MTLIPHVVRNFFRPIFPKNSVAISADYVAILKAGAHPAKLIENSAYLTLPAGVVSPSYSKPNVLDREMLQQALSQAVQRGGLSRKEVNLLIPDTTARVFLISLESLPARAVDLTQLLQFKVKKSIPFSIDEAAMSYQVQNLTPTHYEVILTVMNRSILKEYESTVEAVGLEPGFVTVEHFGIAQLLDTQSQAWRSKATLLFRLAPRAFTTSIYHQGHLRFYRAVEKDYRPAQAASLTPEMLFDEIYPSLAYFQDKFQNRIEAIYFSGLPFSGDRFCAAIQKLSECATHEIRLERAVGGTSPLGSDELNQVFAPLVGVELGTA